MHKFAGLLKSRASPRACAVVRAVPRLRAPPALTRGLPPPPPPCRWEAYYQYGSTVQTWGSAPPCLSVGSPGCTDKDTGSAVCCTESCAVVGLPDRASEAFTAVDPHDAAAGFDLAFLGEPPTGDDPYRCDSNPATGAAYPRVTHYRFLCDPAQRGFARLAGAAQNASDDCEYFLTFYTDRVCLGVALSGGWVFVISVLAAAAAYLAACVALNYRAGARSAAALLSLPPAHAAFWGEAVDLMFEGLLFLWAGCKQPTLRLSRGAEKRPLVDAPVDAL
jgi:hypothetical protein